MIISIFEIQTINKNILYDPGNCESSHLKGLENLNTCICLRYQVVVSSIIIGVLMAPKYCILLYHWSYLDEISVLGNFNEMAASRQLKRKHYDLFL